MSDEGNEGINSWIVGVVALVVGGAIALGVLLTSATTANPNTWSTAYLINVLLSRGGNVIYADTPGDITINGDLKPDGNNTRSIGISSLQWLAGWFNNLHVQGTLNGTNARFTTLNASQLNAQTGNVTNLTVNGTNPFSQLDHTAVIVSAGSPTILKNYAVFLQGLGQAVYVVSGNADDEIQTAINSLPVTGGSVLLCGGGFNISAPIVIQHSWITLEGQNSGQNSPQNANGTYIRTNGDFNAINVVTANGTVRTSGVTIRNLGLFGFNTSGAGAGISVSGNIGGWISDRVQIQNMVIGGFQYGVYGVNTDDTEITNSWISENGRAIFLNGGVAALISGNTLADTSYLDAVYLAGCQGSNVVNNVITNVTLGNGIALYSCFNIEVSGNTIKNIQTNGKAAVFLSTTRETNVASNAIYNYGNTVNGIGLTVTSSNNTVVGNTISQTNTWGIVMNDNCDNNLIASNTITTDAAPSIGVFDTTSQNNVVMGNILVGGTPASIQNSGTGTWIKTNKGFLTESSGNLTINSGSTVGTVTHGLAVTPAIGQITLTLLTATGNLTLPAYVSGVNSTTFNVTLQAASSANITYGWSYIN